MTDVNLSVGTEMLAEVQDIKRARIPLLITANTPLTSSFPTPADINRVCVERSHVPVCHCT
jgi:hypothetical protein